MSVEPLDASAAVSITAAGNTEARLPSSGEVKQQKFKPGSLSLKEQTLLQQVRQHDGTNKYCIWLIHAGSDRKVSE